MAVQIQIMLVQILLQEQQFALHLNKDQLGYKYVMSTNRSSGAISAAIRYDSSSYSSLSYNTLYSINSFSTSIYILDVV